MVQEVSKAKVAGVILAGGKSQRMGRHKALLPANSDLSFIDLLVQQMQMLTTEAMIGGCPEAGIYVECGVQVLPDPTGLEQVGPLAGILSALQAMSTDFLLVVPCDSPVIPENLLPGLMAALLRDGSDIAYAHDGRREQPLYALLKKELLPSLQHYLDVGEKRVFAWVSEQKRTIVDFSTAGEQFANINTPADYAQYRASRMAAVAKGFE